MLEELENWKWRVEFSAAGAAVLVTSSQCPHGLGLLPSALGWQGGGHWREWRGMFEHAKGALTTEVRGTHLTRLVLRARLPATRGPQALRALGLDWGVKKSLGPLGPGVSLGVSSLVSSRGSSRVSRGVLGMPKRPQRDP